MKKFQLTSAALLVAVLFSSSLFAQDWVKMMQDPSVNFHDVQNAFNTYYAKAERQIEKEKRKARKMQGENLNEEEIEVPGTSVFKRWEWYMQPRVGPTGERFAPDAIWKTMEKYKKDYPSVNGAGTWTFVGPSNTSNLSGAGRLTFIRVHPTNPNTIFVGTPAGGLWTSTNGGSSWTVLTDNLPQVIGCSYLDFDPTNPSIMYLATGDGDGGDNNSVGVLKSTDGGVTWAVTGLSFGVGSSRTLSRVLVDPSNGNNIIACGSSGIYRSTNAGASWTQVQQGGFKDMEFMPGTPATMYCCGTDFYKSTNGGATWTKTGTGLPAASALSRMAMAVTAASPSLIYLAAGTAGPNYGLTGIYKSTNGGTSFAPVTNAANGNQQWYDLCIAVNPANAQEILLGQQTGFQRSTNGGTSWSAVAGNSHVDYHEVMYTNSTTAYLGSDGGIWKSTDNGATWSGLNNNLAISELYGFGQSTTNANLMITGWQDNGTNRLSGTTWSAPMGGDGMLAFVSWANDNNMWGSQYNGSLNKSTNQGVSFTACAAIAETCPWVTPWNEDPITGNTIYAGCANLWKSTNGGTSWTKPGTVGTGTTTLTAIGVSPVNNQVMFVAKGGLLYKSVNGGGTWTAVTTLPSGSITDIKCHTTDVNKLWVSFSGFSNANKVFQSIDQGATWTNLSASIPNVPVNCIQLDKNGNDALYIGTDVGVFFKDATMNIWQPFYNGLPTVIVTQLEIYYAGSKIRASTYGRGVWESGLYAAGAYAPTANYGSDHQIGCPSMGVQFTDYSAGQPISWSWTFQGGTPATSTSQNPLVVYNTPGTYSVSLTVTNANGSDTKSNITYITVSTSPNAAPTASGKNYCGPGTVSLTASPSAPGSVHWWNQPSGGTLLATGNNYTTGVIAGQQTFYVDEAFPAGGNDLVGALDNTMGTGASFTASDIRGLYFDVTKPVILNTVDVYPYSTGNRTIEIIDGNGNWVTDTTVNVTASPTTLKTVTINRTLYPGTGYFIKFRGLVDCYRNAAGAVYPYTSSTGDVTITNSNAGASGYYYFFYNWTFTEIVCNTSRTAVTVTDTCSATGMTDLFSNNYVDVYPNPNNGEFNVAFHVDNTDNYVVKVTNTVGQVVYEEKLDNFSGTYSKKMDMSSLSKGVYMLNISNTKNQTVKKVLIH